MEVSLRNLPLLLAELKTNPQQLDVQASSLPFPLPFLGPHMPL